MTTREDLLAIIQFYKETQPFGHKEVEKQITIFSDHILWLGFADPRVLPGNHIQTANDKTALLTLFHQYNEKIKDLKQVNIDYLNEFADETQSICGFTMLIEFIKDEQIQPTTFFNTVHFHVDQHQKITKAFNWMGALAEGRDSIQPFL